MADRSVPKHGNSRRNATVGFGAWVGLEFERVGGHDVADFNSVPFSESAGGVYNNISTSLSPLASHSTSRSRRFPSQSS